MNLNRAHPRRIHCIGIKGIGLSALAQVLAREGHTLTGSDVSQTFPADQALRDANIEVFESFDAKHIHEGIDVVVVSNAYLFGKENPEVEEARKQKIPILSYPKALGEIFSQHLGIAVSGSHGKSSTSALLAVTLEALGRDPYAVIGAIVKGWDSNARIPQNLDEGEEHLFVIEADEYRYAFWEYSFFGAIVTNIDWDHPDVFATPKDYADAYVEFLRRGRPNSLLVVNGDDEQIDAVLAEAGIEEALRYGFANGNALQITNVMHRPEGITVSLLSDGEDIGTFQAALYGDHQAMNVAATVAMCLRLGEKPDAIRKALTAFTGTVRRFDIYTKQPWKDRPIIIDDYAHHPTEITATLAAARQTFPDRSIRMLFQPHTFSRTQQYFSEFVSALLGADDVALLKTFGSAREEQGGASAKDLADKISARYFATHEHAVEYYKGALGKKDVLLIVGAGDGDHLAKRLAQ